MGLPRRNTGNLHDQIGTDRECAQAAISSLCLDSNKQVVYNSASDNCLSSTRATKHDIQDLQLDSLSLVDLLQPVSFVYNGSEQVRYGFIAEDTANVDAHLATYDAAGAVSGIDDRSILAIVIGALKDLWAKVLALIASDEAQNARIEQLEEEVAALKAAAGAQPTGETSGAPTGDASTVGDEAADDVTGTTPPSAASSTPDILSPSSTDAAAAGGGSDVAEAPGAATDGTSARDVDADTSTVSTPVGSEPVPTGTPEPANDNQPSEPLPATGTQ